MQNGPPIREGALKRPLVAVLFVGILDMRFAGLPINATVRFFITWPV